MQYKRAKARWVDEIDNLKRLEIGYSVIQPTYPYWVQPLYYTVMERHEMEKWVRATFGDTTWDYKGRWVGSDRKYWFCNEADRTFFILRWS
jgi:hypothetical protein